MGAGETLTERFLVATTRAGKHQPAHTHSVRRIRVVRAQIRGIVCLVTVCVFFPLVLASSFGLLNWVCSNEN